LYAVELPALTQLAQIELKWALILSQHVGGIKKLAAVERWI